jgi:phasin
MNESSNPQVAAEKARDTYRKTAGKFAEVATNTEVPEAMRTMVENSVAQTRELYERSKDAFEAVLQSWERTFDAAGQGAVAVNRKVIEFTQRNINSGFDLAKSLAGAKNLSQVMELQAAYWHEQLDALGTQAEEIRTLSSQMTADVTKPFKDQAQRSRTN